MKNFSTTWKKSKTAGKQRKYRANAPLQTKGAFLSAHLSSELRKKHGLRSLRVRVGDTVKVVRGTTKKRSGKVERVNIKKSTLYITGIEQTKRDGSKVLVPHQASNVIITELKKDKRRLKRTSPKKEETNEKKNEEKKETGVKK